MKYAPALGIAALVFIAVLLIIFKVNPQIAHDREVLIGVKHAGPCRAEGIKDPECRRQARLILAACADQPKHCAKVYGIKVVIVEPGPNHEGAVYPGLLAPPPHLVEEITRIEEGHPVRAPSHEAPEKEPAEEEKPEQPKREVEAPETVAPSQPLVVVPEACVIVEQVAPIC